MITKEKINVAAALHSAAEKLKASGIAEASREAKSLLAFVLEKNRVFLIAHSEYELNKSEIECFENILERRASREPFQYITGKQEFYGLDFFLTPDVLIPRPETELIVENAIEILCEKDNSSFCEVGIGSGCLAVSILSEIKPAVAVGLDISEAALKVARKNAERHEVADRLKLKISDVFGVLKNERFDLIVSNPPYIPSENISGLQPEVRDFEPLDALTDGRNGLSIIEKIISESPRFLKPSGFLLMEIGFNQSIEVGNMFAKKVWESLEILPDLQGIPRMVKAAVK